MKKKGMTLGKISSVYGGKGFKLEDDFFVDVLSALGESKRGNVITRNKEAGTCRGMYASNATHFSMQKQTVAVRKCSLTMAKKNMA
jgi:hypothetical protein